MQLSISTRTFVDKVREFRTPTDVMVALDKASAVVGLHLLCIIALPRRLHSYVEETRIGENLFFHPNVPKDFLMAYREAHRVNGPSAMTLRAQRSSAPFTFAEAEHESSTPKNWIFRFLRQRGRRDGFYCVYRTWAVVFYSDRLLALPDIERARLVGAGAMAIAQIEALVGKKRKRSKADNGNLSARELDVLQQRAFHPDNASVAKALDIDVQTVDMHLRNVRKKLKIDDTAIALLEAYKRGLIEY